VGPSPGAGAPEVLSICSSFSASRLMQVASATAVQVESEDESSEEEMPQNVRLTKRQAALAKARKGAASSETSAGRSPPSSFGCVSSKAHGSYTGTTEFFSLCATNSHLTSNSQRRRRSKSLSRTARNGAPPSTHPRLPFAKKSLLASAAMSAKRSCKTKRYHQRPCSHVSKIILHPITGRDHQPPPQKAVPPTQQTHHSALDLHASRGPHAGRALRRRRVRGRWRR
jgi:hypothetical protein